MKLKERKKMYEKKCAPRWEKIMISVKNSVFNRKKTEEKENRTFILSSNTERPGT